MSRTMSPDEKLAGASIGVRTITQISLYALQNLLISFIESGTSNFWAAGVDVKYNKGYGPGSIKPGESCHVPELYDGTDSTVYNVPFTAAGWLEISTQDPESDPKPKRFNLNNIKKGLQIFAEKYPRHFADLANGNDDANTADIFVQCVLFGEEVFA